jgi:hypothetical protein
MATKSYMDEMNRAKAAKPKKEKRGFALSDMCDECKAKFNAAMMEDEEEISSMDDLKKKAAKVRNGGGK